MRRVYIAIMRNSENGRGLSLTANEVRLLALDDAIMTRAEIALRERERNVVAVRGWRAIQP